MTTPDIGAFPVHEDAVLPVQSTNFAACYDLNACLTEDVNGYNSMNEKIVVPLQKESDDVDLKDGESPFFIMIEPGARLLIPSGFIYDIPENYSLRFHPRSGLSYKKDCILANCEAVIDYDYIDQSYIVLANRSQAVVKVRHKERVCQMELAPVQPSNMKLIDKPPEKRGNREGGIGSTGSH